MHLFVLSHFYVILLTFFTSLLGAKVNTKTEETQETALTLACCGGFMECVEVLLSAGADIEAGCATPIMEAAQEGHMELVQYLCNKGNTVICYL